MYWVLVITEPQADPPGFGTRTLHTFNTMADAESFQSQHGGQLVIFVK